MKNKKASSPSVSIVLPVYNGKKTLKETLDSIFSQTFRDYEVIAVNDGSRDQSLDVLRSYSDSRLRIFDQKNAGLAATLNFAILHAKSDLISRIDQDDLMDPKRLELQFEFLKKFPDIGLVGTWSRIITDEGTPTGRFHRHPIEHHQILFWFQFNNYFVHSSVMFRKKTFESLGGYATHFERQPEDYELWSRFTKLSKTHNIPLILTGYRETPQGMSRAGFSKFENNISKIGTENALFLQKKIKEADEKILRDYVKIGDGKILDLSLRECGKIFLINIKALRSISKRCGTSFVYSLLWSWPVTKRILMSLFVFQSMRKIKKKFS